MFVDKLLRLRDWERDNIPLLKPQIAFDLILLSMRQGDDGDPPRLKDFHLASRYSEDRVREVLLQLRHDGWIELLPHRGDARSRCVVPTAKAVQFVKEYEKQLRRAAVVENIGSGAGLSLAFLVAMFEFSGVT